jgi:hypothetical protein
MIDAGYRVTWKGYGHQDSHRHEHEHERRGRRGGSSEHHMEWNLTVGLPTTHFRGRKGIGCREVGHYPVQH